MLRSINCTAQCLSVAALLCSASAATASPGSGVTFTTLATGNMEESFRINSERIKFQTKDPAATRVQSAVWAAGSYSGWHSHPGVLIAVVKTGSVTVWDGECNNKTYGPGLPLGSVFVEGGDELMQATSSGGATEYLAHTAPAGNPIVYRNEAEPPACVTATTFRVPKH